ncbi:hypothetical protein GMLC_21060 [Geomonas limicola]|uniref:Glycosyltransferase 61 catalytic domain-containing protein n=1 Tax=Geomonas limicola TaxID=2740186 RepID=A0A6V8N9N9_9BACT|nr:glycosyltransferase family 61 protein [Geomonas limicola]GFO68527.1 hypothetical protein GMLC_21060 [Geomonas limicola]
MPFPVIDAHSQNADDARYFRDVFLYGREGIPLQGERIINRFTNFPDEQLRLWLSGHQSSALTGIPGVTLPLYGDWSGNFWHWIYEALPAALTAHRMGFAGNYLIPALPFAVDTLKYLGIPAERIYQDDGSDYHLECMYLPGKKRGHRPENLDAVLTLRSLLRERFVEPGLDYRLYVSRNGRPQNPRRVINEEQLQEVLEKYGFLTLHMEHLTLEEQLRYTCNASALVTPHGAGMTHTAFMTAGALVLELFAPSYVNPCQVPTCQKLGHRYYQLTSCCLHTGYPYSQDIEAYPEMIEMTLSRELLHRAPSNDRRS